MDEEEKPNTRVVFKKFFLEWAKNLSLGYMLTLVSIYLTLIIFNLLSLIFNQKLTISDMGFKYIDCRAFSCSHEYFGNGDLSHWKYAILRLFESYVVLTPWSMHIEFTVKLLIFTLISSFVYTKFSFKICVKNKFLGQSKIYFAIIFIVFINSSLMVNSGGFVAVKNTDEYPYGGCQKTFCGAETLPDRRNFKYD